MIKINKKININNVNNVNNKIKNYQFSEKYLIHLINNEDYFSSKLCLEYQLYLTPYFCFRYLYNNIKEPLQNRIYYNNIIDYFRNQKKFNINLVDMYVKIFDICMAERYKNIKKNIVNEIIEINDINMKKIKPLFSCNAKCNECETKQCDY